ncbi:DUF4192 domain-containing protein [Mycetocola zhadangensis]|uniref:DUF4192 family protein n=1 Tax=Mycetocola zhadangensis TaxID=1164595 RepID=A0A3L7IT61_9MICO|nr:DUF4192 domain-containing protein [Mycetocola zhadangensis]RLQ81397.1 DUF4192 family protein [Mycetocola zhadangensis]GGF02068.1 hypothetical protein GCM10011313_26450 [Mycetocola zhadangensis]
MTTIIQAHDASDFLALVPTLAGFQPHESIVLVAFRGNRTCGALRIDLPPEDAPASVRKSFATTMLGMVCKIPGVDAMVPVIYTDDTFERYSGLPRRALVTNLTTRARYHGFLVRDALCVASDGWGSYLGDCPRGGLPLDLITQAAARQNRSGAPEPPARTLVNDQATLEVADEGSREEVSRRFRELELLRESAELAPVLYWEYGFDGDIVAFADDLVTAPATGVEAEKDAALLAYLVQSPAVRDIFLITWGWGTSAGDECALTQRMFTAGEDISAMPGAGALGGWDMPRPEPERIRRALAVLKHAAARLSQSTNPPLLTMIGWLHWALGAGSIAGMWIQQAQAIDPDYGLADLLNTMLRTGHLPDWAFDVPPEALPEAAIEQ